MSIGFSKTTSNGLSGMEAFCISTDTVARSLIAALVISPKGVPCNRERAGLAVALGVGNDGGKSCATEGRPRFVAAALLRFRGDGFLVGDSGSGAILSWGSNIWVGSMSSVFRVLLPRAFARGVTGSSVVFRRLARLGLLCGAGVNSSSSSSGGTSLMISSSESFTTTFLRVAALLEGRTGEMEAIVSFALVLCVGRKMIEDVYESTHVVLFTSSLFRLMSGATEIMNSRQNVYFLTQTYLATTLVDIQMDDFEVFEELFSFDPIFAYNEQTVNKILKCRRSMENELFMDRLLKTLGIEQGP